MPIRFSKVSLHASHKASVNADVSLSMQAHSLLGNLFYRRHLTCQLKEYFVEYLNEAKLN